MDSLLSLVPYLLPKYTNTTVTFLSQEKNPNEENTQVEGQLAGGYAGAMQSGQVDNSTSGSLCSIWSEEGEGGISCRGFCRKD